MQFAHSFDVARPRKVVWQFVRDIPTVLSCIPGCKSVTAVGEGRYAIVFTESVGPLKVEFHLTADVTTPEPDRRLEAKGSGKDVLLGSTMQLKIAMALDDSADSVTRVSIDTDLNVFGKLATLGFGMMERKARESMNQFAITMKQKLQAA